MTSMMIKSVSEYRNHGQACEQSLAYALTGEMRSHDHVAFDMGSDIPEYAMSVKSARFTLASANVLGGECLADMLNDYFERVASSVFAYVTNDMAVYMMDCNEFREFLERFAFLDRESEKNGGGYKVRAKSESKAMLKWFASHAMA